MMTTITEAHFSMCDMKHVYIHFQNAHLFPFQCVDDVHVTVQYKAVNQGFRARVQSYNYYIHDECQYYQENSKQIPFIMLGQFLCFGTLLWTAVSFSRRRIFVRSRISSSRCTCTCLVVCAYLITLDFNDSILRFLGAFFLLKVNKCGQASVREALWQYLDALYFTKPKGE